VRFLRFARVVAASFSAGLTTSLACNIIRICPNTSSHDAPRHTLASCHYKCLKWWFDVEIVESNMSLRCGDTKVVVGVEAAVSMSGAKSSDVVMVVGGGCCDFFVEMARPALGLLAMESTLERIWRGRQQLVEVVCAAFGRAGRR
jgi:hypothetical protein